MAINLASKYSTKLQNRFTQKSVTTGCFNNDYDWDGVNAINIYTLTTEALGNYTRSGYNRYGTTTEVQDTVQNLPLTRDRAISKSIDKRNKAESMNVRDAAKWLVLEQDEQLTPELDVYRMAALATAATSGGGKNAGGSFSTTSSANAWTNFLTLMAYSSDRKVPMTGRIALMTNAYYNFLKQGGMVIASEDYAGSRHTGDLGRVEGATVRTVPSSYFPTATDLIITHPAAMVSPEILSDFKIHQDAPGISGSLIEVRWVYDAFALVQKLDAITTHTSA